MCAVRQRTNIAPLISPVCFEAAGNCRIIPAAAGLRQGCSSHLHLYSAQIIFVFVPPPESCSCWSGAGRKLEVTSEADCNLKTICVAGLSPPRAGWSIDITSNSKYMLSSLHKLRTILQSRLEGNLNNKRNSIILKFCICSAILPAKMARGLES